MSFRNKIILSYLIIFSVFLGGLYPLVKFSVQKIAIQAMYDSSRSLIEKLQKASNEKELIQILKEQKSFVFFRISVISPDRKILYDSHTYEVLGSLFSQEYVVSHPEVLQAFRSGYGYQEDESRLLHQKFAYTAITFNFQGKPYVLRTGFPYKYVTELSNDFEKGILVLAGTVLLLFSLMTWLIINHLTQPIRQIIRTLKPYQKGETDVVPTIKLAHAHATDEFMKLANTLNSLSVRIQKHIANLKDFVANASHELKTPLTIIRGFAETLHENPDLPPETFKDVTSKIVRNCLRMNGLIKDLLTLADVENIDPSRLKSCNLYEIVNGCREAIKTVHVDAKIEIMHEGEIHLEADPHLMEHAFLNLMDNAAKYSSSPAKITVSLKQEGTNVVAKVADQGMGIPKEDLEHIFQRFYTVDKAHSRKMGGSGLGLAIVETIVEKHAGHISVDSQVGVGTTFTVELPIKHHYKE